MLRLIYKAYYIILFLFIPVFGTGVSGADKTVDSSSVIRVQDNLLTVKVKDMPLNKVLKEIANQIPTKFIISVSAEELIMADFSNLPMEKGLKRLLRDYNYTIINGTEKSKGGEHEIRKVIILSKEGNSRKRKTEPMMIFTEEPSPEPQSEYSYDEDVNIEREEREFIVNSLRDMLQEEDAEVRLITAEELGDIGGSEAIQALEDALADENEDVRKMAAEKLRQLEGE